MVAGGGIFLFENNRQKTKSTTTSTTSEPLTTTSISTMPAFRIPNSDFRIPILMYHYIRDYNVASDQTGTNLSVSPKNFDLQMKWLKDNGYQTINLSELNNTNIKKPIVLTFDDGYADAFTDVLSILQKYNFTATFYLISGFLNRPNFMTTDQVQKLDKAGMIIGAHTKNHIDLETATIVKQTDEITGSKSAIEKIIGHSITDFCYPSGKYSIETIKLVEDAGFKTAVTTKSGSANSKNSLFELPRLRIENNTSLSRLIGSFN